MGIAKPLNKLEWKRLMCYEVSKKRRAEGGQKEVMVRVRVRNNGEKKSEQGFY